MKAIQLALVLEIIISATCFLGCKSNDDITSTPEMKEVEYAFRDSLEQLTITLYDAKGSVENIDNQISFLQVSSVGSSNNGNPMLQLQRIGQTPKDFEHGNIMVTLDDNSQIKVIVISEGELTSASDNDGEYTAFEHEWWNQEAITYYKPVTYTSKLGNTEENETVLLPWAASTTSNIPREIFEADDHSAARGWVMAYNMFATESNGKKVSKPYFSLYNKYTGILRTFYYQFEDPGLAGEFAFLVTPTSKSTEKYPYYHSLQYAIPAGISQAKNNAIGCKGENTYQQYFTPYTIDPTLKPGWYAFDIDMSCYNPNATSLFQSNDYLTIDCTTSSSAQITLSGCFGGTSEGTTSTKGSSTTSSANGMNYNASMDSGTSGASEALSCFLSGDFLKGIFKGGMSMWNFGSAMLGLATDDYETIEEKTGTINQSFTGNIDLSGYITQATSNNAKGLQFKYNAFSQSDLVGRGVWSLQNNPVVYVVNDVLLGEDWGFVCDVNNGYYGYGGDPGVNNFNLFTFFDPTSLIFNINTNVFKNIRNAEMTWTYGVYPKQEANHTSAYRDVLLRITPAKPKFIDGSNNGKIYKSSSSDFANMEYIDYPVESMTFTAIDSTKNKVYEVEQEDAKYRYFGCLGNEKDTTSMDCFIVDPVVTLPSETNKFFDFETPDFVVGVMLKFNYTQSDGKECTAIFSKRFIPEVKAISKADMLNKYTSLQNYCNNGTHQTVNGLAIKHKQASAMLKRFFATAKYIKEHESK